MEKVYFDVAGKEVSIETGRIAKQANGAVLVTCGETVVMVTACAAKRPKEGVNFFPLTVDYREKTYAAGRIPGGFFKREARPTEHETLVMRLIDRPLRPLFDDNYFNEVQIMCQVLSYDGEELPDVLAMIGASAALSISDIPLQESLGAVRVAYIDGEYVVNPQLKDLPQCDLDLIMAGTADAIMMVEGESNQLSEEQLLEALKVGHEAIQAIVKAQEDLISRCGKTKMVVDSPSWDQEMYEKLQGIFSPKVDEAFNAKGKANRDDIIQEARDLAIEELFGDEATSEQLEMLSEMFYQIEKKRTRSLMFETQKRVDGRGFQDIRPISTETSVLPRTHGSSLFTRGETQALVTVTLGSIMDEQMIDSLDGLSKKKFLLHYNFPPFSVGEARPVRSVSRREIGHGNLAERALKIVNADREIFPYTIRIVSEITESNGSSSMASVCGGSMALMDAGVPIKGMVSGIAMGLIKDEQGVIVLSDILGTEDHLGDMDFKVAGTSKGITAFQMDVKVKGIDFDIMREALEKAKAGRFHILDEMQKTIETPREKLSKYAPKIISFTIPVDKIRDVIGPGGKVIKKIIEQTGVLLNVDDDGTVSVSSSDQASLDEAVATVHKLVEVPEIGKIYEAKVVKIMDFGAFVEFLPGKEGLVHISQIDNKRIEKVEDVLSKDDIVRAKLIDIDKMGRKSLSIKAVLNEE
ncbi:polyribonucleotide nucleotidyltransferase [PVC group bacterium (ex Bugula neritina AB1)]|nr:polyribonucleotide nucleotidyltransferase [PVC group bacterium (ex Bugula neritina AB1)]